MMITELTLNQKRALLLANRACNRGTREGLLICCYGNEFFIAGGTRDDGVCHRSTLESLRGLGLVEYSPGLSGRGQYRLTTSGTNALLHVDRNILP